MKFLIEYYLTNRNNFSKNQDSYIKQILFYMLTTHYYIYCVYAQTNKKEMYKEITAFDKYLRSKSLELYNMMYEIGQIKCNRKTKFIFVKINPHFFSKLVTLCGKILRHKGV